jgi:hypothetical protein
MMKPMFAKIMGSFHDWKTDTTMAAARHKSLWRVNYVCIKVSTTCVGNACRQQSINDAISYTERTAIERQRGTGGNSHRFADQFVLKRLSIEHMRVWQPYPHDATFVFVFMEVAGGRHDQVIKDSSWKRIVLNILLVR